jgi:hypothetical protein
MDTNPSAMMAVANATNYLSRIQVLRFRSPGPVSQGAAWGYLWPEGVSFKSFVDMQG